MEVTKDTMPAKYLAHSERSESASLCYYLQQTGKPVGNPGASGKLGVVGWPSRSLGAGRPRSGPAFSVWLFGAPRSFFAAAVAESLRPGRPLALS